MPIITYTKQIMPTAEPSKPRTIDAIKGIKENGKVQMVMTMLAAIEKRKRTSP